MTQGTGTRAGDEAELKAIAETVTKHRKPDQRLYVGSVKSNVRFGIDVSAWCMY